MAYTRRVYDTFTGSFLTLLPDHTPDEGGAWSQQSGANYYLGIANDLLQDASGTRIAQNATDLDTRQLVQATRFSAFNTIGVALKLDASWNGYGAFWRPALPDCFLFRLDAGVRTDLDSDTAPASNDGDTMILACNELGQLTVSFIIGGTPSGTILSATDTAYAGTKCGIVDLTAAIAMDNFEAFDESSAPAGASLLPSGRAMRPLLLR